MFSTIILTYCTINLLISTRAETFFADYFLQKINLQNIFLNLKLFFFFK